MGFSIILANGDIPTHEQAINLLQSADHIICCDGAVENLIQLGFIPDVIVGDMDSISQTDYSHFQDRILKDSSEEYNDLQKALKYCLSNNWNEITILGGFGKREDHSIANLSIMHSYYKTLNERDKIHAILKMVTNYGVFTPILHTTTFQSFSGQQVSVFPVTPNTKLTFHGLKYPVHERIFEYLWEGSLNESESEFFTIQFDNGEIIVYQAF